jgi:hypothetical protein
MRNFSIYTVAIALAFFKPTISLPSQGHSDNPSPPYLNDLAQADGKLWFGTAADIPGVEQQDVGYMTILNDTRIFGQVTPANYMKVSLLRISCP